MKKTGSPSDCLGPALFESTFVWLPFGVEAERPLDEMVADKVARLFGESAEGFLFRLTNGTQEEFASEMCNTQ